MTFNYNEFRRRNEAQFARQERWLRSVGLHFIGAVTEDLVRRTPGFENQAPPETRYIPTGRLRGGWNLSREPPGWMSSKGLGVPRDEHGPFSYYGAETIERIAGQTAEIGSAFGKLYLVNDVGYGRLIVRGEGRHRNWGPRNWPKTTANMASTLMSEALARAAST